MLDILRLYLVDAVPPEMFDQIDRAHAVFERCGLDTANEGFEQILMLDDETDPNDTQQSIINLTLSLQHSLLIQHQVRMQEDVTIDVQTDILTALLDLPDTGHPHDVLNLCELHMGSNEKFCEIVSFMSHRAVEELLPHVEYVSAALITQIRTLMNQEQAHDDDGTESVQRAQRLYAFKLFMDSCQQHEAVVQSLVYKGVDAGFPFDLYVNLIGRDFEAMDPQEAALNLIGMALLSEDGHQDPGAIIAGKLETLIADPSKLTMVNVKVRALLLQFAQVTSHA